VPSKTSKPTRFTLANRVIEGEPAGANGLIFLPFLGGERAPLWDANARGSFFGLNNLHTRADMLRAVMEGICMNIATVYQAVCDLVGQPKSVTATGGFARAEVWRQMLADVLNCPVNIPESFESGCLGAITMAMKSLGMVDSLSAVQDFIGAEKVLPAGPGNRRCLPKVPAALPAGRGTIITGLLYDCKIAAKIAKRRTLLCHY
jgi:Sugar (pentulose and hexulose) kinases